MHVSLPSLPIIKTPLTPNRVNHLTAVLSESPTILPTTGRPYKNYSSYAPLETSPLLKPFAVTITFHPVVVEVLYELGHLYFVLDIFTKNFMPEFRGQFEDIVGSIEGMGRLEGEIEREWIVERLKMWGDGKLLVRRSTEE
jgi:hypothetical protein